MPSVSLIIPIYKVEKYLNQCVDSVISQNYNSIEIILVDDGSPDSCPAICDKYANEYSFIHVIHKANGGLSSARNAGIQAASGDYIVFMDSDDWWNSDVRFGEMMNTVLSKPDTDMFLFTSLDYYGENVFYKRAEHEKLGSVRTDTPEHYYEDLLNNGNLEVSAATKIIKKSFLLSNDLLFKEGITSEDSEWMLRVLRKVQKVDILDYPLYICRMGRYDSITNTIGEKNILALLNIIQSSIDFYAGCSDSVIMKYEFCYCAYLWFCALGLCGKLSRKEFKHLISKFKDTSSVCTYSNSSKTKAAYRVYKLLGLRGGMFVLNSYLKFKNAVNLKKRKIDI